MPALICVNMCGWIWQICVCAGLFSLSLSLCMTVLWALSYRAWIQACALNVASGRWAFKGMLSHADRQPCSHARVKTQQVCVCCLSTDRMERFASLITARTVVWVWTTQLWFEHSWEGLMPSTSFISCYKVPQFYIVMLHRYMSVCLRAKMFIK